MSLFLEPFVLQALAIALGVAIIAGSLGCFVIWRKMSYYSDALSHSALLGVAIGIALGVGITGGLLILILIFSVVLFLLERNGLLGNDTILGLLSHLSLALGVVILGLLDVPSVDLLHYLFGDLLSSNSNDLLWVYMVAALVLTSLVLFWQPLLLLTLNQDLAKAEGVSVNLYHIGFIGLIALSVAVCVQTVGVLLMTALLIMPAAIARIWSSSAKQMFVLSIGFAMFSAIAGLALSIFYDVVSAPAIVLVLGVLFFVSQVKLLRPRH